MIELFAITLFVFVSLAILIQDFKSRSIHVVTFLVLLADLFLIHFYVTPFRWIDTSLHLVYSMALMLLSAVALKLFYKKKINKVLGLGDMVYLLLLTPLFSFPGFIIWLNLALIFSLLAHTILKRLGVMNANSTHLIPLAGYLAIMFTFALFIEYYVRPIHTVIF